MKKYRGGKKSASNEDVILEPEAYFAQFNKWHCLEGWKKLEYRWDKCIALKGITKIKIKN